MLLAGFGLGPCGIAIRVGVLSGARQHEAGKLSGASATGHEISEPSGSPARSQSAANVALGASVAPLVALPAAKAFLAQLRRNPQALAAH